MQGELASVNTKESATLAYVPLIGYSHIICSRCLVLLVPDMDIRVDYPRVSEPVVELWRVVLSEDAEVCAVYDVDRNPAVIPPCILLLLPSP